MATDWHKVFVKCVSRKKHPKFYTVLFFDDAWLRQSGLPIASHNSRTCYLKSIMSIPTQQILYIRMIDDTIIDYREREFQECTCEFCR